MWAFTKRSQSHDRQIILDSIRQRHASGAWLAWSDVCLENRGFACSAKNAFGSWRKAIIAAGIGPEVYRHTAARLTSSRYLVSDEVKQREIPRLENRLIRTIGVWHVSTDVWTDRLVWRGRCGRDRPGSGHRDGSSDGRHGLGHHCYWLGRIVLSPSSVATRAHAFRGLLRRVGTLCARPVCSLTTSSPNGPHCDAAP